MNSFIDMVWEQTSRTTNGSSTSRRAYAARKTTLLQAVTVYTVCIAMLDAFAPACLFRARSYRLALVVDVRRRWYARALAWSLSRRGHAIDGSTVGQHANHPPAVTRLVNRGGGGCWPKPHSITIRTNSSESQFVLTAVTGWLWYGYYRNGTHRCCSQTTVRYW